MCVFTNRYSMTRSSPQQAVVRYFVSGPRMFRAIALPKQDGRNCTTGSSGSNHAWWSQSAPKYVSPTFAGRGGEGGGGITLHLEPTQEFSAGIRQNRGSSSSSCGGGLIVAADTSLRGEYGAFIGRAIRCRFSRRQLALDGTDGPSGLNNDSIHRRCGWMESGPNSTTNPAKNCTSQWLPAAGPCPVSLSSPSASSWSRCACACA